MYMSEKCKETHEVWWIADTEEEAELVSNLGYNATDAKSEKAARLFELADVYVTENYREAYPTTMNEDITILNLWHGVGLKHIELALGPNSALAESIVRKYARNYQTYKNNLKFLVTSPEMEKHFIEDMRLEESQIIRGGYPRNQVYSEPNMRTDHGELDYLSNFNDIYLFAPTYRFTNVNGSFKKLLPDLDRISQKMAQKNSLFILKLHPFMLNDPEFVEASKKYENNHNILFWDDRYDVYEIFNKITVGIVDYSSIFYDLLGSGVKKFIRYIPDYEEYVHDSKLIGDYFDLTGGVIVRSFEELLATFNKKIPDIENKQYLLDYFFKYQQENSIQDLINTTDGVELHKQDYPELHTFDIFDTLIKRRELEPKSIFTSIQEKLMTEYTGEPFESYLVENYPVIRHQVEMDLRDVFRKTTNERKTDKIEVLLVQILDRLQNNYDLTDDQVKYLYDAEVEEEIKAVQPIQGRINELFALKDAGNDVMLVSDMYLPKDVIRSMLEQADPRLNDLPLYLSSDIGYQKSTGKLFTYLFFDIDYHYSKWVHYGDNKKADGVVPRRLGIQTFNHDMDEFIPNEEWYIEQSKETFKNDAYKLATLFQRRRWSLLDAETMSFDESSYYAYSYVGPTFVPYVNWALRDAIKRGYETVYFISRDGYYLKQIADVLIEQENLPIKSKFIYGSRKAWRVASFIDEVDPLSFTPFGMFTLMDNFDDMVKSSQLPEEELLEILPQLEGYRNEPTLKGDIAIGIRKIFAESKEYKQRLLEIAAKRRPIVREYLQQGIDFDEKFAFIEFWGRGYTQDTFSRLLVDAAGKEVKNPFYYVRNFTDDIGNSIRHRFTQMPANFSDFESIFATTPYDSIPGYEYADDNKIEPIFIPQENEFHEKITENIEKFAYDYANLDIQDQQRFDRFVGESAYKYYFEHPFDSFITSVFAQYKDNVAMYGETRAFAPILTAHTVRTSTVSQLREQTKNIGMSLCRSSEEAREAYQQLQKSEGLNVASIPETKDVFPVNDLNKYIPVKPFPFEAVLLKDQHAYASVKWSENSKSKNVLKKGTLVTVTGIDWANRAVPRLKTEYGYLTAARGFITTLRANDEGDIQNYYYQDVKQIIVKQSSYYYETVNFVPSNRLNKKTRLGEVIDVINVEWTGGGTPRLKTRDGYITANKNLVSTDVENTSQISVVRDKLISKLTN